MIPPTLFFFLSIAVAMQGFLWFHIIFKNICSSSVKYVIGILIGIALNLWISLGTIDILMMLILPIHEHDVCFYLFVSFSISSVSYNILSTGLLHPWLGFLLGILFFLKKL